MPVGRLETPPLTRGPTRRWPPQAGVGSFPAAKSAAFWRLRIAALSRAKIGALLRKEGIYSSHLNTWRQQRAAAERTALEPQKRGRKVDLARAEDRRVAHLTQENDRLRRKLAQAHTIIEVQKKLCSLLGLPADETPSEWS